MLDFAADSMLDDKGLVEAFSHIWNECDYAVGHYASRFDLPMLQTKCAKYRLPPMAPKPHIDTWRIARDNFKLHSNRLATLAEYFGVEHSKTPITFDHWLRAAHGDKRSLKYIVEHCKFDIIVLGEVFDIIRPWIKNEPSRSLFMDTDINSCISCGSPSLQRRGYAVNRTRRMARFQCQSCGKWMRANSSEARVQLVG